MSKAPIIRYPLDLSGVNIDNRINYELHKPPPFDNRDLPVRAIMPRFAPYFSTGAVVALASSPDTPLELDTDYSYGVLAEQATVAACKETFRLLVLKKSCMNQDVVISYQTIGGPYITETANIDLDSLNNIEIAQGAVLFKDVYNPNGFPPIAHLHTLYDVKGGMGPLVDNINRITIAKAVVNAVLLQELKIKVDFINAELTRLCASYMTSHITSDASHSTLRSSIEALGLSKDSGNVLKQRANGLYYGPP